MPQRAGAAPKPSSSLRIRTPLYTRGNVGGAGGRWLWLSALSFCPSGIRFVPGRVLPPDSLHRSLLPLSTNLWVSHSECFLSTYYQLWVEPDSEEYKPQNDRVSISLESTILSGRWGVKVQLEVITGTRCSEESPERKTSSSCFRRSGNNE